MNIEKLNGTSKPRHRVWCRRSDLAAGDKPGTYTINNEEVAVELGFGSEIIVIDQPGMVLFYDNYSRLAYDWSKEG